jgi:hypothetical protein
MFMSRLFIHKIFIEKENTKAQISNQNTPSHLILVHFPNLVYPIAEKPNNIEPNDFKSKIRLNKIEKREYKVNNNPISNVQLFQPMLLLPITYLKQLENIHKHRRNVLIDHRLAQWRLDGIHSLW